LPFGIDPAAVDPQLAAGGVTSVCLVLVFGLWMRLRGAAGGRGRRDLLLCGPSGGGKTTVFQRLTVGFSSPTHTSVAVNVGAGTGAASKFRVVDCPGHPRLRDAITPYLPQAKVIAVVFDATAAADEQQGAPAVATLLHGFMSSKATEGAQIVIACNKREDPASYSASAVRRMVEREMTRILSKAATGLGTMGLSASSSAPARAQQKRSEMMTLDASGEFTFDNAPRDVSFVEISTLDNSSRYSLAPLVEAMAA
jgi:signal recognition particle receptor subunit beta